MIAGLKLSSILEKGKGLFRDAGYKDVTSKVNERRGAGPSSENPLSETMKNLNVLNKRHWGRENKLFSNLCFKSIHAPSLSQ